jgi:hypothetical protein
VKAGNGKYKQPTVNRSGDELFIALLVDPMEETVHGTSFCDLMVRPVEPQHLLTPLGCEPKHSEEQLL